jgi:hypothetical protein
MGTLINMSFSGIDRALLMTERGLGPLAVSRLEAAGFDSIERIAQLGAEAVVGAICAQLGTPSWGNRRRALERALHRAKSTAW